MSINDISEKLKSNPEHTRRVCTELFCKNKLARKKEVLKGDVLIICTSQILFLSKKWREAGITSSFKNY